MARIHGKDVDIPLQSGNVHGMQDSWKRSKRAFRLTTDSRGISGSFNAGRAFGAL